MARQTWPPADTVSDLTLIRGVAASGYVGPKVVRAGHLVALTARINNGNGLTLSSSFVHVLTLPEWARPSGTVLAPASDTGVSNVGVVLIEADGNVSVAASTSSIAFSVTFVI